MNTTNGQGGIILQWVHIFCASAVNVCGAGAVKCKGVISVAYLNKRCRENAKFDRDSSMFMVLAP